MIYCLVLIYICYILSFHKSFLKPFADSGQVASHTVTWKKIIYIVQNSCAAKAFNARLLWCQVWFRDQTIMIKNTTIILQDLQTLLVFHLNERMSDENAAFLHNPLLYSQLSTTKCYTYEVPSIIYQTFCSGT